MTAAPAPVALFAYKRPEHLKVTLASLRANPQAARTHLYLFCDGPRRAQDEPGVEQVRELARQVDGFARVDHVFRDENFGLARSIIDGVTRVVTRHGRVIVIEDDLRLSPHFLRYMNDGLSMYADDERVASIHGYVYPTGHELPDTFFLRGADCWGWATWERAWRAFQPDGGILLQGLRERHLSHRFDLDGCAGFVRMLQDQTAGRNDSWAIRWHAQCFLRDWLTLYPGRTLVENIGNDSSGTHAAASSEYSGHPSDTAIAVKRIDLAESGIGREAFKSFQRRQLPPMRRLWSTLMHPLRRGQ